MPADRLTLYYSGTDRTGSRRRNAQTASTGGSSLYIHKLFGGGHPLRLHVREGSPSSYRPQGGLARRALLTKVATSRAAARFAYCTRFRGFAPAGEGEGWNEPRRYARRNRLTDRNRARLDAVDSGSIARKDAARVPATLGGGGAHYPPSVISSI